MTTRFMSGRPLPLQVPTAFVRIRPGNPSGVRAAASRGPRRGEAVLIRVGSRGSRLALTQAEQAADRAAPPGIEIALVPITTAGDRDRTRPFGEIGSRGVFVKELEEALLAGRIDVAVHSAKDMTSTDTEGLAVGAYPPREDPRDALCGADALRPGMRIGTASVRRRAQLLALEPTLSIEPLRGNIDTRLRKRGERGLDAVVLAACGLDRLGLDARDRAAASTRPSCSRKPVRARSRCRCARARRSWSRRRTMPRRAAGSRPSAAASPSSAALPRARGRTPRRLDAHRARRRRGRRLDRAAHGEPTPTRSRASCSRSSREGHRHAGRTGQEEELVARPAWRSGTTVVLCPLLEVEPLGDSPLDVSGYDWVIVTSVNGARELRRRMTGTPQRVAAIGQATATPSAAPTSFPAVSTQEGLLAELPRPAGRVLFAGAEGARRLLVDELDADFVALYRTRELTPAQPPRATWSCWPRLRGAGVRRPRCRHSRGQHRAADHRAPRGRQASRSSARPRRTTSPACRSRR